MDTVKVIMDMIVCATLCLLLVKRPHLVTVYMAILRPATRSYFLLRTEGTRVSISLVQMHPQVTYALSHICI